MFTRIPHIDFAAGIMILWMVLYHVLLAVYGLELYGFWDSSPSNLPIGTHAFLNSSGRLEILNPCIIFPWLSFFMPWFFYKSGIFFHRDDLHSLWEKDSHKLLRTFVIWSLLGNVVYAISCFIDGTATLRNLIYLVIRRSLLMGSVPINHPLWFLLSLFIVHVVANIILPKHPTSVSLIGNQKWLFHIHCACCVLIGFFINFIVFMHPIALLPRYVANGAAGLSFYALGYWLGSYEYKWYVYAPCMVVYIICCIFGFPMVDMSPNKLLQGIYVLWIPTSWCCIVAFNTVCRWISHWVNKVHLKFTPISIIGRSAMPIYISHAILIYIYI